MCPSSNMGEPNMKYKYVYLKVDKKITLNKGLFLLRQHIANTFIIKPNKLMKLSSAEECNKIHCLCPKQEVCILYRFIHCTTC